MGELDSVSIILLIFFLVAEAITTQLDWNGIWNSSHWLAAGISKVIQHHHERYEKIQVKLKMTIYFIYI